MDPYGFGEEGPAQGLRTDHEGSRVEEARHWQVGRLVMRTSDCWLDVSVSTEDILRTDIGNPCIHDTSLQHLVRNAAEYKYLCGSSDIVGWMSRS